MPYQMQWIVEKRVILSTFSGIVTRDELLTFINTMLVEVRKGTAPVFHISDSLNLKKVELSLKALLDLVKTFRVFTELGAQIDINRARTVNTFFASAAAKLIRIDAHTVTSLDEAIDLVKRLDHRLGEAVWELPTTNAAELTAVAATPPMDAAQ